jgi:hypothetical protein
VGGVLVVEIVGAAQGDGDQDQVALDDVAGAGHARVDAVGERWGVVGVDGVGGDRGLKDVDMLRHGAVLSRGVPGREWPGAGGLLGVSEHGERDCGGSATGTARCSAGRRALPLERTSPSAERRAGAV